MEPGFTSIQDLASFLAVSEMTVNRMVHAGELPAVRVQQQIRIPIKAVHEYLDAHQVIPDPTKRLVLRQRKLKVVGGA